MDELILFSYTLTTKQLFDWVKKRNKEYEIYLINESTLHQYLIKCNWDVKNNDFEFKYIKWQSSSTFENKAGRS